MLTSVYPLPNDLNKNATKVVNYFTEEWVKQGHNVIVIHNVHRYPLLVHKLPKKIKEKIAAKIGFNIPEMGDVAPKDEYLNGVKVFRIPISKLIPHAEPSKANINKQCKTIINLLGGEQFIPDIIMGHWASPQAAIICQLKDYYNCRTSLVLHGLGYVDSPSFARYLNKIDAIGCRSISDCNKLKEMVKLNKEPFVCYSGIPDGFVNKYTFDENKFNKKPKEWRFVYVGRLVKYKNVDKLIIALAKSNISFHLDVIGTGAEDDNLKNLAISLSVMDKVSFHGRKTREEVLKYMQDAHVFAMTSKGEVFGLVYLEAMCASCIVIGSKGEGIDGVIIHGKNGILVNPDDVKELQRTIKKLDEEYDDSIKSLVLGGYETSQKFTDSSVSFRYLKDATGY